MDGTNKSMKSNTIKNRYIKVIEKNSRSSCVKYSEVGIKKVKRFPNSPIKDEF